MELNSVIISISVLLSLVVLAQVLFFQLKESKLNNIILGLTKWMAMQEKINNALSAAIVELDTSLVSNGSIKESIAEKFIWESNEDKETD